MFSYNRVSECFLHNRVSECFLKLMQLEGNIIIILLFVIDLKSIRHFAQTPHSSKVANDQKRILCAKHKISII